MNRFSFFAAAACAAALFAGCRQDRLVTAEGMIQHQGAPLDGATVTVHYADGNVAQDVTHSGGKFALTYLGKAGAMPGTKLKVRVYKTAAPYSAPPRSDATPPDPAGRTSTAYIDIMIGGGTQAKSGTKVPPPAAVVDAQCELTIPAGGSKDLKIEVP